MNAHDDFWPLTAVQTLFRQRGYQPNDGGQGVGYEKGDRNAMDEQMPLTRSDGTDLAAVREYWSAVCENAMFDLIASQDRMAREHRDGRIGTVGIEGRDAA